MLARGRHRVRQDDRNSVPQHGPLIPPRIDAADRDRFGVWGRDWKKTRVGAHESPFGHAIIIMQLTDFAEPRRGIGSSPGQELLGVMTSHGPSRDCYTPAQKSSGWSAQAPGISAADADVSAQRLQSAIPSEASPPVLLQREVPPGSAEMVAMEGPAAIPGDGGGSEEA